MKPKYSTLLHKFFLFIYFIYGRYMFIINYKPTSNS